MKVFIKKLYNMGEPKKRVSPRIANQVNRDFERLIFLCILGAVRAANRNAIRLR